MPGPPSAYVLRGATIISPERDRAQERGAVVVESGRIAWVGAARDLPETWASARQVDVSGRFLVPGLIDSHVHVGHAPFFADHHYETRPDLVEAYFAQLPCSFLFFGFTTLIDLDLRDSSRKRFEKASPRPRLLGNGRGIRLFEGYGPAMMPEEIRYRVFPVWTFDEQQRNALPPGIDPAAHSPEALVARAVEGGALLVKTYHESGFGGAFDWPVPSPRLLGRIVDAAHRHDLPVGLHATGLDGYRAGLEAGVDFFAHGLWHWPGSRLAPAPPVEVREVIRAVAAAGIDIQPTTRVLAGEKDTFTWEMVSHPSFELVVPPELLGWLITEEGRWAQRELMDLYDRLRPDPRRSSLEYLDAMNERARRMLVSIREAGAEVLFGSDTPASEGVGNPPGLNGHLEMLAWAEAGYTPLEILKAATLDNARAFGLEDELGSIEVGKRADFLILQRDPRQDVRAFDSIEQVVADGELYRRQDLSARQRDRRCSRIEGAVTY